MKKLSPFTVVYGIVVPLLCLFIYIILMSMDHPMTGLLFYSLGAFTFCQAWFNVEKLIKTLNS